MIKLPLLLAVLLGLSGCFSDGYNYVIVNHSVNFIEKDGVIIVPGYIVEHKEGKKYLTVTRLNTETYQCEGDQGDFYSASVITDEIEYRVIQVDTGDMYITANRGDYIQYLSKNNIKDLFTTERVEDANFRKNEKLKKAFDRSRVDIEKKVSMGKCSRI